MKYDTHFSAPILPTSPTYTHELHRGLRRDRLYVDYRGARGGGMRMPTVDTVPIQRRVSPRLRFEAPLRGE